MHIKNYLKKKNKSNRNTSSLTDIVDVKKLGGKCTNYSVMQ